MKTPAFFQRSELTQALWSFRSELMAVGIFSMVANILLLTPTVYMLQIYDRILVSGSELTLAVVSLIALFLFGLLASSEWFRSRLLVRLGVRLDEILSTRVFNACFEENLRKSSGGSARAFSDLTELRQFVTGNGIFAFFDVPWTPIYILVLCLLHPLLGLLAVVFACIQIALARYSHNVTQAPLAQAADLLNDSTTYLQGKLRNAEVLEPMGIVGNLQPHWLAQHEAALIAGGGAQAISGRAQAISKFVQYCQQSLMLGAGALLVIDGQLSPGSMIAANVLASRALAPIGLLIATWRGFLSARNAFGRLESLLQAHPEQRVGSEVFTPPSGQITLQSVTASAPGRQQPILKNIDLSVAAGTVTVVMGPSGSGKSTLARVMMGIWPDVSGDVLLDGAPLKDLNRPRLGPYLGYLPQDIELFDGTIAENIARFGEIDSEKVIAATRATGLHEMILRFPKGYDTPIGDGGGVLSGGMRQRLGLARAIYGNPALIVLDEPNANLDDLGEAALARTVADLKSQGKTVFLISHRPGIVAVADRLLLLRAGAVQAEGPRDAVLAALQAAQAPARTQQVGPPVDTSVPS